MGKGEGGSDPHCEGSCCLASKVGKARRKSIFPGSQREGKRGVLLGRGDLIPEGGRTAGSPLFQVDERERGEENSSFVERLGEGLSRLKRGWSELTPALRGGTCVSLIEKKRGEKKKKKEWAR